MFLILVYNWHFLLFVFRASVGPRYEFILTVTGWAEESICCGIGVSWLFLSVIHCLSFPLVLEEVQVFDHIGVELVTAETAAQTNKFLLIFLYFQPLAFSRVHAVGSFPS